MGKLVAIITPVGRIRIDEWVAPDAPVTRWSGSGSDVLQMQSENARLRAQLAEVLRHVHEGLLHSSPTKTIQCLQAACAAGEKE